MWDFLLGKRSRGNTPADRRVKRRLVFNGTTKATLQGFEAMWKIPAESDLSQIGSLFADDAYLRKEYVEMYDLIRTEFAKNPGGTGTALIRGSSGTGKSAFLQYLVARIRLEANDVLVVRGRSFDSRIRSYLHLSTNWLGFKTATVLSSIEEAEKVQENCTWTIVDGCDWEPIVNCTVGAASPSTPWKGFRAVGELFQLCMPPWSLSQLEQCSMLTTGDSSNIPAVRENYQLVGGIARWALGLTPNVSPC